MRAPWRDLPQGFGPYTTCYNRFIRWRRAGAADRKTHAANQHQPPRRRRAGSTINAIGRGAQFLGQKKLLCRS
jgi:transposase